MKEEAEQIDENWHNQPLNVLYKAHAAYSHAPKHDNFDRHLKAIESAVEKKHGKDELQKMKQHSTSPKSAWYAKSKLPEEVEQIDEISKGAAIRAAGVAGANDDPRTNRIIDRIEKKFGREASDHAVAHATAQYYGREGKSRGTDPLNSVLDRPTQM